MAFDSTCINYIYQCTYSRSDYFDYCSYYIFLPVFIIFICNLYVSPENFTFIDLRVFFLLFNFNFSIIY